MADILLRGFEMPTDASLWLLIRPDGTAHKLKVGGKHGEPQQGVAVPIPDGHGRLIDADALIDALETQDYSCAPDTLEDWTPQDMTVAEIADITHAPTIVPAEGGTEDG